MIIKHIASSLVNLGSTSPRLTLEPCKGPDRAAPTALRLLLRAHRTVRRTYSKVSSPEVLPSDMGCTPGLPSMGLSVHRAHREVRDRNHMVEWVALLEAVMR